MSDLVQTGYFQIFFLRFLLGQVLNNLFKGPGSIGRSLYQILPNRIAVQSWFSFWFYIFFFVPGLLLYFFALRSGKQVFKIRSQADADRRRRIRLTENTRLCKRRDKYRALYFQQ